MICLQRLYINILFLQSEIQRENSLSANSKSTFPFSPLSKKHSWLSPLVIASPCPPHLSPGQVLFSLPSHPNRHTDIMTCSMLRSYSFLQPSLWVVAFIHSDITVQKRISLLLQSPSVKDTHRTHQYQQGL